MSDDRQQQQQRRQSRSNHQRTRYSAQLPMTKKIFAHPRNTYTHQLKNAETQFSSTPPTTLSSASVATSASTQSADEYLAQLESRVKHEYPQKIEALVALKEKIMDPANMNSFDSEDLQWVNDELRRFTAEHQRLTREWEHKSELYHQTIMELHAVLETREQVLNEVEAETGLFANQPDLVKRFAAKQAELVQQSKVLQAKVFEEWNSGSATR